APALRRVLVLDGSPGPWLPTGFDVVPQGTGGLDERLADAFARCDGPALLIGMDTPQVTPELLAVDFTGCDAHFGPAEDGGFWALGLARPDPALLRGVPMSTATTGAAPRDRLLTAGLRVRDLPTLRDVDTAADAHAVAALAPPGRFPPRLDRDRRRPHRHLPPGPRPALPGAFRTGGRRAWRPPGPRVRPTAAGGGAGRPPPPPTRPPRPRTPGLPAARRARLPTGRAAR